MKILQIFSNTHEGNGVVEVLKAILLRMSINEDIEIGVYTNSKYNEEMEELLKELNVKYYYNKSSYITSNFRESVYDWNSYDLVHIHGVFFLKNMLLARKINRLGLPYIISPHGNLMESALNTKSKHKKYIFRKLFSDRVLSNASAIHALANEEKNSVEKIVNNKDIFIIPNGMDPITRTSKKSDELSKEFNVLFVGRIDVIHKGLDLLFESILDTTDYYLENNIKFNFVGYFSSKYDEKYFNSMFRRYPVLRELFVIHGPKYGVEKERFFINADVFVHTSRYEGMPIAVLEALNYQLPCIVTAGTNMSEIINASFCGKSINFNKAELHSAIVELRSLSKQQLNSIGKRGSEYLRKELSWDNITQEYIKLYSKLVSDDLS